MRLWTIHPSYLDEQGLKALWREGLMAKKSLSGITRVNRNHPQLNRFQNNSQPLKAINCYLNLVWIEANSRGYVFDNKNIPPIKVEDVEPIVVTNGQVHHEFNLLKKTFKKTSIDSFEKIKDVEKINVFSIFKQTPGSVEPWENIK